MVRIPQQLRDYRWVYKHPVGEDGSETQKMLRGMLAKDPKGFMATLSKMEAEHSAKWELSRTGKSAKVVAGEESVADEGTEKCLELAEKILKESVDDDV